MRRVVVESPYRATAYRSAAQHRRYLIEAMRDCVGRGESPLASHAILPEILDDSDIQERAIGIKCGWAWGKVADAIAVYSDLGVSEGMALSIDHYQALGVPVEWRKLDRDVVLVILKGSC